MRKLIALGAALAITAVATVNFSGAADQDSADQDDAKPKHSIKNVMKKCMKGGLCKKVAGGEASDDEKKLLVEMFTALAASKPPRGDADSWKAKTSALVKAATAGDNAALKKAANCAACHKVHKPKKK